LRTAADCGAQLSVSGARQPIAAHQLLLTAARPSSSGARQSMAAMSKLHKARGSK